MSAALPPTRPLAAARLAQFALTSVAGVLGLAALGACSADGADTSSSGEVNVVTSTNVFADIASAVGGANVEVSAFIDKPSADPHSYEASSRDILSVTRADVVIENGGGYDDFMDQLLETAKNDPTVLNAVQITGAAALEGAELNEHVWYDLACMQVMAGAIADALADADPTHASTYADNAHAFNARLQKLVDRETKLSQTFAGRPVAITEPVPGFMVDALGLVNLTPPAFSQAIEEGEDLSVEVLNQTLSQFSDHQVDALIYNDQTTGPATDQVRDAAIDAGIPVVPVTETLPAGTDYIGWMSANLAAIEKALS